MTYVYFVRHAEPDYNNHDDCLRELSEKGRKDRKLVTEYLSDIPVDVVLSSPFKRAADTVLDFAEAYGHEIEIINDFRERRVGSWIEDFNDFAKKQWEDFNYKLPDGESLQEVQDRNMNALMDVLERYPEKTIVIGSHGTALAAVINYFHKEFGFRQFERIKGLMPWIVCFTFEKQQCVKIEHYDVFTKKAEGIYFSSPMESAFHSSSIFKSSMET